MNCEEARELLEAFHDDELTPEMRSAVATHVKACPTCAAALATLNELRTAIKAVGPYPMPDELRRKASKLIADSNAARPAAQRWWIWGSLAASHAGIALLGALLAYGLISESYSRAFNLQELVSAHVRSLMDDRLMQVASSDTHTVRPWFAGKLDFSPPVDNPDREGFPLLGGRVDYVGGAKVAALVYGRNKHVINVFVVPASAVERGPAQQSTKNGFSVVEWQTHDLRYRAISDLNASELADFARKLGAKFG